MASDGYNSKYTGEEVEALLDQVAAGGSDEQSFVTATELEKTEQTISAALNELNERINAIIVRLENAGL